MAQLSQKNKLKRTINSYFLPAKKNNLENDEPSSQLTVDLSTSNMSQISSLITPCLSSSSCTSSTQTSLLSTTQIPQTFYSNDIGQYIGKAIDDFTKHELLENSWLPPKDYIFPYSEHIKGGKQTRRYVGHQHLNSFKWLVFSPSQKGLFCKYCPIFNIQNKGGFQKNVNLLKFVTQPLTKFAKIMGETGDLIHHEKTLYHKEAVEFSKSFLKTYHNPDLEIHNLLNTKRLKEVNENRLRLIPIVESIIFLCRQNIPLRGHRDDGMLLPISSTNSDNQISCLNEGNFRELLKFRVKSGDRILQNHLQNSSSKATYISKTIQNEIIECCAKEILNQILSRITKDSGFYSIIFDETLDVSKRSQISLVLRYIYNNSVREDFVMFVDAFDEALALLEEPEENKEIGDNDREKKEISITGKVLGKIIIKQLNSFGLDLNNLVGIGTDGCSVMLSELCGAVSEIIKVAPNAHRCPCYNHSLNNSISQSSRVKSIRNLIGVIKEVVSFFSASAKRTFVLKKHVGHQLVGLCETRWVERHEGVMSFMQDMPNIIEALLEITTWRDLNTSGKAKSLATVLCDSEIIISLCSLSHMLSYTLPLSKCFQKKCLDLHEAANIMKDTLSILSECRKNVSTDFKEIYKLSEDLAKKQNIDLKIPRYSIKQTKRANYSTNNTEEYYKLTVFIPLLDNVINDLKSRFSHKTLSCFNLSYLLPENFLKENSTSYSLNESDDIIKTIADEFQILLSNEKGDVSSLLRLEFKLWKQKWNREKIENNLINSICVTKILANCDEEIFPLINRLLTVFITLPISNASAERTFSTLRRLKTWLRSTMSETRLTGLALLNIHRDINVEVTKVIDRFSKSNRKLDFAL
ncbi:zinc finger MYM-type protein 1-like isoform X2 [Daktulosphaira vitifoliae]|uniref:zinc finger MYM-type protein 1-like isoform X2 n=1 Tax=Daktulosphaira vitifoliae TaxID=58002 RepID=UPI0021AA66A0|nr:zinc finger MYM-type protein 1-like isoform X2 [Daktulosphaira vitifoliae]